MPRKKRHPTSTVDATPGVQRVSSSATDTHPDCKVLVCFVYDPLGRIGNPEGLERDLSGLKDGLPVKVLIAPRT